MKIKLLSLAFSLPALIGCVDTSSTGPHSDPDARKALLSLSASQRATVSGDNGFGLKLFARVAGDQEGNVFVSPMSVAMALTMVYNGAAGTTLDAMSQTLGYQGMDRAAVNAFYAGLIPALSNADAKVTFNVANSIWTSPNLSPKADFVALNKNNFDAEVSVLDFTNAAAAGVINKWVSDKTQGKIPTLADNLDPSILMLLINALYFHGDWSKPFDEKATSDQPFHLADGGVKTCKLMSAEGSFAFELNDVARVLELPYGDSLFAMDLIQPLDSGAGMTAIIDALKGGAWSDWQNRISSGYGFIYVPKFQLETQLSLKPALAALGMSVAFTDAADFSGIAARGLMISDVLHKTYLSVDEKGTTAAAVTSIGVVETALPGTLIRLDRPFVVLIREKTSGAVLFVGRIMDPSA